MDLFGAMAGDASRVWLLAVFVGLGIVVSGVVSLWRHEFGRLPIVTFLMSGIVLAVSLADFGGFRNPDPTGHLLPNLSLLPQEFLAGSWWQIFTYGLVHANLDHLAGNIFYTLIFAGLLESLKVVSRKFLVTATVAAVLAGGISVILFDSRGIRGFSPSGYAFEALLLLSMIDICFAYRKEWRFGLSALLLIPMLPPVTPHIGVVSDVGHMGGFAVGIGLALGHALVLARRERHLHRGPYGGEDLLFRRISLGHWPDADAGEDAIEWLFTSRARNRPRGRETR